MLDQMRITRRNSCVQSLTTYTSDAGSPRSGAKSVQTILQSSWQKRFDWIVTPISSCACRGIVCHLLELTDKYQLGRTHYWCWAPIPYVCSARAVKV